MTFIAFRCPHCQSDQSVKRGKTARGTQRYLCQNTLCAKSSFLLNYCNRGCLPEVKQTIIDMSLNASGVRDTARSLELVASFVHRSNLLKLWKKIDIGEISASGVYGPKKRGDHAHSCPIGCHGISPFF